MGRPRKQNVRKADTKPAYLQHVENLLERRPGYTPSQIVRHIAAEMARGISDKKSVMKALGLTEEEYELAYLDPEHRRFLSESAMNNIPANWGFVLQKLYEQALEGDRGAIKLLMEALPQEKIKSTIKHFRIQSTTSNQYRDVGVKTLEKALERKVQLYGDAQEEAEEEEEEEEIPGRSRRQGEEAREADPRDREAREGGPDPESGPPPLLPPTP